MNIITIFILFLLFVRAFETGFPNFVNTSPRVLPMGESPIGEVPVTRLVIVLFKLGGKSLF